MQIVTASDYNDWKANPVTKAFMLAVAEQIGMLKEDLISSAGLNQNEDNFKRGYATALGDVMQFRIDDLQEATDND